MLKCNRCGESGGILSLYGKIYGVDNQTACKEIKDALGKNEQAPSYIRGYADCIQVLFHMGLLKENEKLKWAEKIDVH